MSSKSVSIKKIVFKFTLSIAIVLGFVLAYFYYNNFIRANVDTGGQKTALYIPTNSSAEDVFKQMDNLKILKDQNSFEWLAKKKNYQGKNVVAGKYEVIDGLSNNGLINLLRGGNGKVPVHITFNQVRDLNQLAGVLAKDIELDSLQVFDWLSQQDSIAQFGFNRNTIISMFVPNTYYVDWDVSVSELMKRFYKEYKKFWNEDRMAKLKNTKLSETEVITLASIVYWETKMPEDKKVIAGVYMNRLRLRMPLQADPTLIFALGDYTIRRVLDGHKKIDSPYNTYKFAGLPPGPILTPPISYIDAVLDYEKHDYLYFVAKEDLSGYSYFAKSYSQHLRYARRYQQAMNKRRIYN